MKLKTFTQEDMPTVRSHTPAIRLNGKSGIFCINKSAHQKIGLVEEDTVVLHNDEEESENWYLQSLGKKGNGFKLRQSKSSQNLIFINCHMVRKIFDSVAFEGKSGKLFIGETINVKGIGTLYTLITASLRNK